MKVKFSSGRESPEQTWVQTAGIASPWVVDPGTGSAHIYVQDCATMEYEAGFIEVPLTEEPANIREAALREEVELRRGFVNLLGFEIVPDEPSESDLGEKLLYKVPSQ